MAIIETDENGLIGDDLDEVVQSIDSGDVVAIPTDTVYALIADVSNTGAADRLFAMKHRSRQDDFSVLVADVEQAMSITIGVSDRAEMLMNKFWPGPLTIVLPRHPDFVADLGSDDLTVGVRCPDNVVARMLCEDAGPVAITTANIEGREPAYTADEVDEIFGENVEYIIDGGTCDKASATVVDCTGGEPRLLRKGAIAWADIEHALG